MKKIIPVVVGILILMQAGQARAVGVVAALMAGASKINLTAKTLTVPGLVTGVGQNGVVASRWGALAMNTTALSTIGGAVILSGVGYGVSKYIDYFMHNATVTYENGQWVKKTYANTWPTGFSSSPNYDPTYTNVNCGHFESSQAATDYLVANCGAAEGYGSYTDAGKTYYFRAHTYTGGKYRWFAFYGETLPQTTTTTAATANDIATEFKADLDGAEAAGFELGKTIVEDVATGLSNSQSALAQSSAWDGIKTVLNGLVDAAIDAAIETQSQSATAIADMAKDQAIANATPEAVRGAVEAGVDKVGSDVNFTDIVGSVLPDAPEKLSLTDLLDDWWDGFMDLPIVSLLDGLSVEASGSPVMSFNIPGFLGGSGSTATVDFSDYETAWALMGQILLTITGIRWTIYLFE